MTWEHYAILERVNWLFVQIVLLIKPVRNLGVFYCIQIVCKFFNLFECMYVFNVNFVSFSPFNPKIGFASRKQKAKIETPDF